MAENFEALFAQIEGWRISGMSFPDNIKQDSYWPPRDLVFHAFTLFSKNEVKRVILGQDPYPSPEGKGSVATGIAFGISKNTTDEDIPRSLKPLLNAIYPPEGKRDITLEAWAKEHKILMLNCALTIPQAGPSGKHLPLWWEFRLRLICHLMKEKPGIKWLAVGKAARKTMERALKDSNRPFDDPNYYWCHHPVARIKADDKRSFKYLCNNELSNFIAG